MTHKIKIDKAYADAVLSGEKTFEVRANDRGYQKGDCVEFQVMDGLLKDQFHKLNGKRYKITYVLGSFVGLAPNYVAFAIKDVTDEMKGAEDYERATEQMEHDALYEPTYNSEDGSM